MNCCEALKYASNLHERAIVRTMPSSHLHARGAHLPSPSVWCSMGLLFCWEVLGTPTMWSTGTCSEKAFSDRGIGNTR